MKIGKQNTLKFKFKNLPVALATCLLNRRYVIAHCTYCNIHSPLGSYSYMYVMAHCALAKDECKRAENILFGINFKTFLD